MKLFINWCHFQPLLAVIGQYSTFKLAIQLTYVHINIGNSNIIKFTFSVVRPEKRSRRLGEEFWHHRRRIYWQKTAATATIGRLSGRSRKGDSGGEIPPTWRRRWPLVLLVLASLWTNPGEIDRFRTVNWVD